MKACHNMQQAGNQLNKIFAGMQVPISNEKLL